MTPTRTSRRRLGALLVALGLGACGPQIGDACDQNADCGTGLRCDLATEGGYCTQTPCRASVCRAESKCFDFGTETTWCMLSCTADDECRQGQVCLSAAASPTADGDPKCLDSGKSCKYCGVAPSA